MPSCEVQRTLVKSPPELWAELSDPASLAKHLGEFGEIRIARVEPETAVEWEAADVRGAVQLKASGWGTKVTLTAVREIAAAETDTPPEEIAQAEPEAAVEPEAVIEPEPTLAPEPEPEAVIEPDPEPAIEPEIEALVEPEPEPERCRGLFARIFRRRRKSLPIDEPEAINESAPIAEPIAVEEPAALGEPEPAPMEAPEPGPAAAEHAAEPRPDLAAELAAVEQTMIDQDAALLTAVLDRLGAAHHRPFSRG